MSIIRISGLAWLIISASFVGATAWAQDYPTKPIRFVVPAAPGGGLDLMARIIAQKLNEAWGQPIVVEHRTGGTGAVAAVAVAKSAPDGYTLFIAASSTMAISPSLQSNLPYDPVKDFEPISLVATGPQVMVVHPSVPAKSVKELVALAKAWPNSLNYASSGIGTVGHMLGEMLKMVTGMKMVHIPYKGGVSDVADLIAGNVQLMFSGPGGVIAHVQSRRLKAIAVAYPRRTAGFEEIPTFAEAGYPAVDATQWYGVLTPAGTPKSVVDRLNREIVRIIQLPEVKKMFFASGYYAESSASQELAQLIKNDLAKWQRVVKASGVRVD